MIYDYSNIKASLLPSQGRTGTEPSVGEKFLSENLDTTTTDSFKFVGVRGAGDDVLLPQNAFINEIKRLVLKPFLITLIGSTKDVFSNKNKDSLIIRDDYFEYLLMDGRSLNTVDYLDLAKFFGEENKTTFNLPNIFGRFEKNNPLGGDMLGSLNDDEIKSFTLTSDQVTPTTQPHNHSEQGAQDQASVGHRVNQGSYWGYVSPVGRTTGNSTVIINPFNVISKYVGGAETQPKHILKQKYIIAKVNF